ncbi:hypothetical protein AWH56_018125 [Anaerobacillus isosaccharinicus]|uniref:Uncharacterized protein n=1 Tax=Anaerobacillus isosaccharinicus TaxID=1532552 RepID=A0A1S2MG90_9BACI|nr:hypothetical protein [Anaerobacillus isosaccharinicus]MBA5587177.1 hypothetical protein [Anaerobacillus isosaccharinicus]QOY34627.1 hypothetical protein AWH56_018125 [Anaerobacillus isosaccharinicus]
MNRLTLLMLSFSLSTFLISGCSSNTYQELMPGSKGEFSVLWITEKTGGYNAFPSVFNKVDKVTMPKSLEEINKKYPKLELKRAPVIVIFNENGVVLTTYNLDEAVEFLENEYGDS